MQTAVALHVGALELSQPRSSDLRSRVERALRTALDTVVTPGCPPPLAAALHDAVFPGGARLRPQLVLLAAGEAAPELAESAAVAVEFIHCASLVHDDLPCFDDAPLRRGLPSVHTAHGEAMAVLVGDALIVHAFEALSRGLAAARAPRAALRMVGILAQAAGASRGLVAGQAMESMDQPALGAYHAAKTASLFEAAAVMGALAGGRDIGAWRDFGDAVGRAYQVMDDLADVSGSAEAAGKPCGRDEALGRPNMARERGVERARSQVQSHLLAAREAATRARCSAPALAWIETLARRAGL